MIYMRTPGSFFNPLFYHNRHPVTSLVSKILSGQSEKCDQTENNCRDNFHGYSMTVV